MQLYKEYRNTEKAIRRNVCANPGLEDNIFVNEDAGDLNYLTSIRNMDLGLMEDFEADPSISET